MGTWLIEHGELVFGLGGALLGLLGSSLSLWLRFNLQPMHFQLEQLRRDVERVGQAQEEQWALLRALEDFRIGLRLPDCAGHREHFERLLAAGEERRRIELEGARTSLELTIIRQISQIAEENRRFREELGRQLQNDARDITRTQVTEDAVLNAVHAAIQSLRDKELAGLFDRMRELERGRKAL